MKKITLSLVLFFTAGTVLSQSFMHGAGLTVFVVSPKSGDVSIGEGFTYSPRFNFLETEKLSLSVGIPLSVGVSFSTSVYSNSYDDDISIGVVLNAPLIVNLNMGRGSTKDNREKFGYFIGAGFGYHHGDFIDIYDDSYSINAIGPATNAGLRFGVGRKYKNIEVRFSYMKGINENNRIGYNGIVNEKPNVFGIACLFNF
jgi:hypothetical protein